MKAYHLSTREPVGFFGMRYHAPFYSLYIPEAVFFKKKKPIRVNGLFKFFGIHKLLNNGDEQEKMIEEKCDVVIGFYPQSKTLSVYRYCDYLEHVRKIVDNAPDKPEGKIMGTINLNQDQSTQLGSYLSDPIDKDIPLKSAPEIKEHDTEGLVKLLFEGIGG